MIICAVIPLIGVNFLPSGWGFPFLILTLYVLNPIFFVYIGKVVGKNLNRNWLIPLLSLLIFSVSTRLIYGTLEPILAVINIIACGISLTVTVFIERRKASNQGV